MISWYKFRALVLGYTLHGVAALFGLQLPPKMSVGGFIEQDGKYLVLDLSYRKGFGFPGGLLEGVETLEEALAREIKEETGLTVTSATYFTSKKAIQYGFPVLSASFAVTVTGTMRASKEGTLSFRTPEEIIANCSYTNSRDAFIEFLAQK
jgi:8-oxo-dGTP pyrophosphatase MutT (NUDIX family)